MRDNDLPREHHQSNERPVRASGYSAATKQNNQAKKDGFATPPPLKGRLFTVYLTSSQAQSLLLNENKRRALQIQNLSADNIYIGIGTPPAFDGTDYQNAFLIPSGAVLTFETGICPIENIYGISTGSSSQIAILECSI